MARIRLKLPSRLPFSTRAEIRITDLNYGAHLGNDSVLSLMHEARCRFLAAHDFTELNAGGAAFIMGDCAIEYKAEGFFGQSLRIEVGAGEYSRVSFDIYYRFVIEGEEKVLALAKTGIVCFDYAARKVVQVPEVLRTALGDAWELSGEVAPV